MPAGYKLTDLGALPEEWEAAPFGQFATPNKAKYNPLTSSKSVPCVELEHVEQGAGALNGSVDSLGQKSLKSVFKKGSVLFGKLRPYLKKYYLSDFDGVCSTEIWSLDNTALTDSRFLYYVVQSDSFIETANNTTGTRMPRASWPDVAKAQFPLPPLAEQQAIAAALGEMDALLAAQRARLAKQRAVKQGLLQGLLSGQQRLPGFAGDWEVKRLGELADITKLAGYEYTKHFNSYKDGGEIIVIRGTNITHNKLDLSDIKTIPRETSKYLKRSQLSVGDMFFAYVGTIGPVYLIEENDRFHLGPNTAKITAKHELDPQYLFQYFTSQSGLDEMAEHISIGAQPSLSMTKIRLFKILTPSIDEQRAIAAVLSEADAYLAALEAEHAKTQLLKQGMMQNLLTGKLRLV